MSDETKAPGQVQPNTADPEIIKQLQNALKTKTSLAPLRMDPKMGKMSLGQDIGTSLLNMFVPGVGGAIQRHIMQSKETQINQVANDFQVLHMAWEESQAMSQNDQEKTKQMFMQDPRVQAILGDKKKQKLLSKAFNIDLMNPEKTTNNIGFQGMKRFMDLKQAKGQMDSAKAMMDHFQKQGAGASQVQAGAAQAGGQPSPQAQQPKPPQSEGERGAESFLKQWPKQVQQPSTADVEKASTTVKNVVSAMQEMEPKTDFQAWYKAQKSENNGTPPSTEQIAAHREAYKLKPMDQLMEQAIDQAQNGDPEGAKQTMQLMHDLTTAAHVGPKKNFVDMIYGANSGNKEDSAALKKYMALQDEMREAYGKGRARYMYQPYVMKDGSIQAMSGLDIYNWNTAHPGEAPPVPSGRLTSAQTISIQQLQNEAGPTSSKTYSTGALKGMYDNIAAFDNAKDRAIFANAMNKVEHTSDWLATWKNALTQVEVDKLSPEGQRLYVNEKRLAETMGRFRASMGLPSTDQSMAISMALMPGPSTPNSDVAKMLLDNLDMMIKQANVPALAGATGGGSSTPSGKKQTLQEYLDEKKKANAPK